MEKISNYIKAHPWATGIIVVVGGIIFIMIFRGSDGGSSGSTATGPSDSQIAADTAIKVANINANAQSAAAAAQYNGQIQLAQIGAGVQLNSDNKAAEVAMAQINAQKDLYKGAIDAQAQSDAAKYASLQAILPSLKKKNRDDVAQAFYTGQPYYPQNTGNGLASNLGGILKGVGSLGSLFSDQRLKENIRLVGQDAKGRNVYEFNYKGSSTKRRGYMAQEVKRSEPNLVRTNPSNGYLEVRVNPFTRELASV